MAEDCDRCGDATPPGYALDNDPDLAATWVCKGCLKPWDDVLDLP